MTIAQQIAHDFLASIEKVCVENKIDIGSLETSIIYDKGAQAGIAVKDIQRINELYNLDKSIGLTPEQKEEQRKLRHEYIQSVRANLRAQLNNVSIKNEDGSITPLKPKGLN